MLNARVKTLAVAALAALAVVAIGCEQAPEPSPTGTPTAAPSPGPLPAGSVAGLLEDRGPGTPPANAPASAGISEVVVGPELVDCVGVGPMQCMVVDGELFYDLIDGFEHESGYVYRLRIERYDPWPELEEPPADAGEYGYRLLEILSKEPAT